MKKCISFILAFVFVIGICASTPITFSANAASVEDLVFTLNTEKTGYKVSAKDGITGDVVIPSEYSGLPVTQFDTWAFYNEAGVTSVTIPNTIKVIESHAFGLCDNLTSVTIPDSVEVIGDSAFYSCDSLTSISLPKALTSIGSNAFYSCGLTSLTIPNTVTSIGDRAFYENEFTTVTIPDSVASLGYSVFQDCDKLTTVKLPSGLTSIRIFI